MTKKYKMFSMPCANAHVEITRDDTTNEVVSVSLYSYKSEALRLYRDEFMIWNIQPIECAVNYSATTARHVNRFTSEFTGVNLYHMLKGFDFVNPVPLVVDEYAYRIASTIADYEVSGKKFY